MGLWIWRRWAQGLLHRSTLLGTGASMAIPPVEFCLEKDKSPVLLEAFLWTVDVNQGERKPLVGTIRINKSLSFQCKKSPGQTWWVFKEGSPCLVISGTTRVPHTLGMQESRDTRPWAFLLVLTWTEAKQSLEAAFSPRYLFSHHPAYIRQEQTKQDPQNHQRKRSTHPLK